METFPKSSGAFRCLLESGEPPAFWLSTPNTLRPSSASRGSTATAIGKLILEESTRSRVREEEQDWEDEMLEEKELQTYSSSHLAW